MKALVATGMWTLGVNLGAKAQALAILVAGGIADGVAGVGVVSAGYAAAILGSAVADFGYSPEATRFIARNPVNGALVRIISGGVRRTPIALSAAFVIGMVTSSGTPARVPILALTGVAAFWVQLLSQILYGLYEHRAAAGTLFIVRILSALLLPIAATLWATDGVLGALLVTDTACATALGVALRSVYRRCADGDVAERPLAAHRWLGVGAVVSALINRRDAALVASVADSTVVGVYSVASQLQNAVATLALVPSGALSTHVAQEAQRRRDGAGVVWRMVLLVSALSTAGGVLVVAASWLPWFGPYFAEGSELEPLRLALVILMLSGPVGTAGGLLLTASVAHGRHRDVGLAWLMLGLIGVPLIVLLAAGYGVVGAALGAALRDALTLGAGVVCWRRSLVGVRHRERTGGVD